MNYPDFYIGISGQAGTILRKAQPDQWRLVPGICGTPNTVSIQSATNENQYLYHPTSLTNTELDVNDACFFRRMNLFYGDFDAFESANLPRHYIRHQGFRLKLHQFEDTTLFRQDASFCILILTCNRYEILLDCTRG